MEIIGIEIYNFILILWIWCRYKETPVARNKAGVCCFGIIADGMRGASGIVCDIYSVCCFAGDHGDILLLIIIIIIILIIFFKRNILKE